VCEAHVPREWPRIKAALFGPRFKLAADGTWHQEYARLLYLRAARAMREASAQGRAAAAARWAGPPARPRPPRRKRAMPGQCPSNARAMLTINDHDHDHDQVPLPLPLERLNDAKSQPAPERTAEDGSDRSSFDRHIREKELMGRLRDILGRDEMARAGGHWRRDWIRKHPGLVERALADLQNRLKEGHEIHNRGAWLEDLLKRWS
jgi:hypothetical protein